MNLKPEPRLDIEKILAQQKSRPITNRKAPRRPYGCQKPRLADADQLDRPPPNTGSSIRSAMTLYLYLGEVPRLGRRGQDAVDIVSLGDSDVSIL